MPFYNNATIFIFKSTPRAVTAKSARTIRAAISSIVVNRSLVFGEQMGLRQATGRSFAPGTEVRGVGVGKGKEWRAASSGWGGELPLRL